jgi:hypothetical protein
MIDRLQRTMRMQEMEAKRLENMSSVMNGSILTKKSPSRLNFTHCSQVFTSNAKIMNDEKYLGNIDRGNLN